MDASGIEVAKSNASFVEQLNRLANLDCDVLGSFLAQ